MNETIAKAYADAEKTIDAMRLTIHMHAHEYTLFSGFLASLGRRTEYSGTYASLGFSGSIGTLQGIIVQVHLEKEESFKDGAPILEWFLERSWRQEGQSEDAEWGYRQVTFKKTIEERPLFFPSHHDWKPYSLTATVRMWPSANGVKCKKVEDGVQPKYKFVCAE